MEYKYVTLDWVDNIILEEIKDFLFDNDITIVKFNNNITILSDDTTSEFPEVTLMGTEENLCKFHKEWCEDDLSDAEWLDAFE